ncbi:Peptidase S16, Lon proteolytic domain containing protein [Candidatus Nanopelagicaceae bacterium]
MIHRNSTLRFSRTPVLVRNLLLLATLIALIAPMNFVLITPGPATSLFPEVLTIKDAPGVKSYPVKGQLNLLTIYVTNPETYVFGAQVLGCWAWGDCVAIPRSVMYQDGATDAAETKSGTKEMVQSQNLALAAARGAIAREFPTVNLSEINDSSIKVSLKNTGGPSGGLVFTLGLVDLLTPADLLQGRNIAGTGTIAKDGTIGPIGGVTEKILGAKKAGATLLFISQENCSELPARVEGITVVAIKKIDQAIDYLKAPYAGGAKGKKGVNSAGIRGCASVGA